MTVAPKPPKGGTSNWLLVSVAGDSKITPFGATLRHYKPDELPELWDVLIGNMSFVGPRPDVPGYADALMGDDREVLKLPSWYHWSCNIEVQIGRRNDI